ncbi:MAG: hypothetical protein V1837_03245 [Candidatus Woesearchaeota archaeon]
MRFGFWSSRPDWKLAREISRKSWSIRNNADVPDKVNRELEKILRKPVPPIEKDPRRTKTSQEYTDTQHLIARGIERFKTDFFSLEEIKYNALMLENERIKSLKDFEQLIKGLQGVPRIGSRYAEDVLIEIRKIRAKLDSRLSDDKEMERRLKGKI